MSITEVRSETVQVVVLSDFAIPFLPHRHRAGAPVLVRIGVIRYEISGLGTNRDARIARIDPAEPLVYAPAR